MKKVYIFILSLVLVFSIKAQSPETLILQEISSQQGLKDANISIQITDDYADTKTGIRHLYFVQTLNGIPISGTESALHLLKNGKTLKFDHSLFNPSQYTSVSKNPTLDPGKALEIASSSKGLTATPALSKKSVSENGKISFEAPEFSSEKAYTKLAYRYRDMQLKLVWATEFYQDETNDWWKMEVDAQSGEILSTLSYTAHCSPEMMPLHEKHSDHEVNQPTYLGKKGSGEAFRVFPLPGENPKRVPYTLVTNGADTAASPFGWLDTNGVAGPEFFTTRGNNVWAKEDTLGNNGSGGFSPKTDSSLVFDFPYTEGARPRENLSAAITNLFYMNNALHDIFHHYGFDEASGNFQQKNYSGKGRGNDYVQGDAQDGSGTNNANFSTPVDGSRPRMQMFLWSASGSTPQTNYLYLTSPSYLASVYNSPQAAFTPPLTKTPISGAIVLVQDSGANTSLGCGVILNRDSIAGKIALVDRGTCTFPAKILALQKLGAVGVIVAQTSSSNPTVMTGVGDGITIPAVQISKQHADLIKNALKTTTVLATLADSTVPSNERVFDSDFDNGVIAHEYGHGISTRLTGGPSNSSCLGNQEQAGEGWSDFFCLALTTRPWEVNSVSRGIGTYVYNQDSNGVGIRPYRYSRSLSINPVNYNSIKTLSVPHGVGFVFCSMLYDIYWDMIDLYGFDPDWYNGKGGNNKAMQLVIDGLKLQKCSPGFVDARDAILLADSINNGFAHKELLWRNFARRGLGFSADQKLSTSRSDGVQAFDVPGGVTGSQEVISENDLRMYPNPSSGYILLDTYGAAFIKNVEVLDINGKVVAQKKENSLNAQSIPVELNGLESGMYFVRVQTSKGTLTKKLILN
ncbi:T9SS-dependent M36 family metallopeptidase [Bacteroidota bacterium]